ncbi:hypothetical protein IAI18_00275 [Acetobacteraceae bacterium H6797]|nr:hypothetical protein [Acetobacteraceae bacterium H6797]
MSKLADRLKALATMKETKERRTEIDLALAQNRWGLRILAIRVLGAWGGPRNKAWLREKADQPMLRHPWRYPKRTPGRWEAIETQAAQRAIAPHVTREDAAWLLNRHLADWANGGTLLPMLGALAPHLPRERIEAAYQDPAQRESLLWLCFHVRNLSDRLYWMRRLATLHEPPPLAGRLLLHAEADALKSPSPDARKPA